MAPVAFERAALAGDVVAAHGEREQAVLAQSVVIAEVFIAEHEAEQALGEQVRGGACSQRPGLR